MARAWCILLWRLADGTRGHAIIRVEWAGTWDRMGLVDREDVLEDHYADMYVPRDAVEVRVFWYDQFQRYLREFRAE